MIDLRRKIEDLATVMIDEREEHYEYKLPPQDKAFLIYMIADYSQGTIDKFVRGSMEHNAEREQGKSFLVGCNHMMELEAELRDLLTYFYAHKLKLANGNNKNKPAKG